MKVKFLMSLALVFFSVNQAWSEEKPSNNTNNVTNANNAKPAVVADEPLIDLGAELEKQLPPVEPAAKPEVVKTDDKKSNQENANTAAKPPASPEQKAVAKPVAKPALPWGYSGKAGPAYWGGLSSKFSVCKTGKNQSPIDIRESLAQGTVGMNGVQFAYRDVSVQLGWVDQSVQIKYPMGHFILSEGRRYALSHVGFHTPSEHTLEGFSYPMEMQIVHKDGDGQALILSVLFQEGAENEWLSAVLANVPKKGTKMKSLGDINLNPGYFLPADMQFYQYSGSLTTPPCTEGVRWQVFKQPVEASTQQIQALRALMGNNARPVQARYARSLLKSWASGTQELQPYEFY
ncbi:carbonic anhydrase [Thiomicrorhabdus aquaedulcis]|uniref:carbonic anhydrase n=1 Tax=Thiomicrorhabdus aquaedulcis TaxID=2211106 RepID=UPI000FD7C809|nr:carbonic anhydrase family protein [Thiomicrorhabdus aquaedulcis]